MARSRLDRILAQPTALRLCRRRTRIKSNQRLPKLRALSVERWFWQKMAHPWQARPCYARWGLRRETTDEGGRFRFNNISQGHYRIWAFKEPLASPREQLFGEELNPGEKPKFSPVRLLMRPGKEIKVTVTSAVTGRPIEGPRWSSAIQTAV